MLYSPPSAVLRLGSDNQQFCDFPFSPEFAFFPSHGKDLMSHSPSSPYSLLFSWGAYRLPVPPLELPCVPLGLFYIPYL